MSSNTSQPNLTKQIVRRVISLTEWNNHHEWPKQAGLRHLVFNADTNGFNKVIRRAGRRVLIDEPAFFEWLDSQNEKESTNND
jgi:hypothetical protein